MPKVPINYSNTIIYKLVHIDDLNDENIYVGHCTNMTQRRYNHKTACCSTKHKEYNKPKYQYIRENGGWDNWKMILIEKYPCNDVYEAIARERYWKKELKATLNVQEPGRTRKERYEDNLEKIKEKNKIYYQNTKEYQLQKASSYRENNREELCIKQKEYRENNKQKIKEKRTQKIVCECGGICSNRHISRHCKSNKHQEWLKNNNLIN